MPRLLISLLVVPSLLMALASCSDQQDATAKVAENAASASTPAALTPRDILARFIEAQPGDVIELPEGKWTLQRSLTLNTDGVTVRGAGMDKTILSFKGQVAGAEGILVNASDFTIEDLAIEDTRGDALKVNEGRNIIIRRVRTEWTGGPKTENGAYGIYPVQTENVLVEGSVAIGASDAGIYVGQSRNIVVRDNRAEFNVAGIEIENSIGADVYNNVAINNTGGILVFSMPQLSQPGHTTRVYNNKIVGNNTANFAVPGTAVAGVPTGTGLLINSNDKVEIFENEMSDHLTAHILISSFFSSSLQDRDQAESFDGYPEGIFIYDNNFGEGGSQPDRDELNALRVGLFGENGTLPDIIWDGFVDEAKMVDGALPAELGICIANGDATFVNVDAPDGYQQPSVDLAPHTCELPKLAPVVLTSAAG
ncbi:MAG: right-handed parallel beta-helix repeat-containing protein [Pseudomonadales bacterium]|nr:right-handed parallel beta-helix repeat-containing protein [Pseudomonadales bacterium]